MTDQPTPEQLPGQTSITVNLPDSAEPRTSSWDWRHTTSDGIVLAVDVDPYDPEPTRRAQVAIEHDHVCIVTDLSRTSALSLAAFLTAWAQR